MNERINLTIDVKSDTSAKISWDTGPDYEYRVSYWVHPFGDQIVQTVRGSETTLTGLEPSIRYSVRVMLGSRTGGTTFVTLATPEVPDRPKKVGYVGVNFPTEQYPQDVIALHWPRSRDIDCSYILTYYLLSTPDVKTTKTLEEPAYVATQLSLEGDGKYVFSVVVSTPKGRSEPTQVLTSTLRDQRPGQVGNFRTPVQEQTSLTIAWDATSNTKSYDVSHDKMDRPMTVEDNTVKIDNLIPATFYEFYVAAVSPSGVVGRGDYWQAFTLS